MALHESKNYPMAFKESRKTNPSRKHVSFSKQKVDTIIPMWEPLFNPPVEPLMDTQSKPMKAQIRKRMHRLCGKGIQVAINKRCILSGGFRLSGGAQAGAEFIFLKIWHSSRMNLHFVARDA